MCKACAVCTAAEKQTHMCVLYEVTWSLEFATDVSLYWQPAGNVTTVTGVCQSSTATSSLLSPLAVVFYFWANEVKRRVSRKTFNKNIKHMLVSDQQPVTHSFRIIFWSTKMIENDYSYLRILQVIYWNKPCCLSKGFTSHLISM